MMDEPIEALAPEDEEVSISTLKDKEIKKIMNAVDTGRDVANNYYVGTIEPKLIEREEIYQADISHYKKKYPRLSEKCSWRSRDVKTLVDGLVPSLMEVFTGADSPVSIIGRNIEDDEKAKKAEALLKYDLTTKNDYNAFCNDVLKDSLKLNIGIGKAWWKREEDRKKFQVMMSPDDYAMMEYIALGTASGKMDVLDIKPVEGGYYNVEFETINLKANYPVVEAIPPSELRFSPEAGDIQDCKFVAHRKIVPGDYLKRMERDGIYEDVDEAMKKSSDPTYTTYDKLHNKELNDGKYKMSDGDEASRLYELYECYVNVDYNNDGIYERLIVHTIGDSKIPIKIQKNEFDYIPFFIMSSERDPAVIFNERSGYADIIEQQQDLKTAVIRQMIINISKANDPKVGFDETKVDVDALLDDSPFVPVRNTDPSRAFYAFPSPSMSSNTMELVNYSQNEIESQTGFTRYNNGLDSNSLNKMLDINTPVPMADGTYKLLKDIQDGDRIIGRSGKPTTVLKAHKIHYPERAYDITFQSGETIRAGGEHLWTVKPQTGDWRTIDTDAMYDYVLHHKGNLYIPRVEHVDFEGVDVPLDPYILGYYLGDGHMHSCRITTADDEVVEYFEEWCRKNGGEIHPCKTGQNAGRATTYAVTGGLWETLKKLHLVKRTKDEFAERRIPECYFYASYHDRIELLRGLMDSDGCHHSGALCIFSQRESGLLDDVIRLLDSLGYVSSKNFVDPGQGGFNSEKPHYNVTFSAYDNPFKISRKADKWNPRERCSDKQKIVSIVPVEVCLMRCLTVDADDGLFCVGRKFTVTHNTATGITAIMGMAEKRQKNLAKMYAETFFKPLFRFLIQLNQKYAEPETLIRIGDENISISKKDLDVDCDLILNVGQGAGTKEARIQYLMLLLQQIYPQQMQIGIVNANSYYVALKLLLDEMGLLSAEKTIIDPNSQEYKQTQQAKAQGAQQAQQQAQQAQLQTRVAQIQAKAQADIAKAKVPKVSVTMDDLPPDAQAQVMRNMGLKSSPQAIVAKELLKNGQG